jgi:hypothetical protein
VLRLIAGFLTLSSITRRARSLENTDWTDVLDRTRAWMQVKDRPALLVSERVAMPCTSGWRRPVIILPESALDWDDERREMVLLHELAHIRRGDIMWHLIAQLAVAVHWFNPFVWAAARSMRADAERAADDLVVGAGATPSDYAAHLLDIVRGSPARREPATVVPFAQRSEFEDVFSPSWSPRELPCLHPVPRCSPRRWPLPRCCRSRRSARRGPQRSWPRSTKPRPTCPINIARLRLRAPRKRRPPAGDARGPGA